MNPNKDREDVIFDAARELPSEEDRAAYLAIACGKDTVLRLRLEEMLKIEGAAKDFFKTKESTAGNEGKPAPSSDRPDQNKTVVDPNFKPPLVEGVGAMIDRYKLLEKIGEGGFGAVYVAEQREPVKRRVALKIIKLGMDTRHVVARFEAERQALALMDHPNIAKVFDAGATEAGRPYFVMELVRGIPITKYCDENHLAVEERLKLFILVCQAIQHAHQKGIIHRDIKPSNILLTGNDGVPVPKVIDFGIAKATQGELTDKTIYTQFQQFIGTPAYMSPEQADMTSLDIDTRSDIYALGVLLYELLVGKTPFDGKELLLSGLDEMRRTIREKEPIRPSTRLTMELAAADVRLSSSNQKSEIRSQKSEEASSRRLLRIKETITLLRGDLDWIVMKCLEKDRARRYETANALAMDVKRHLDNEPVAARPPSAAYRFQKLVRRHKLVFTASAAIFLTLAGAAYYAQTQAIQTKAALLQTNMAIAEELFAQNKSSVALARLARVLRNSPDNLIAAERIMSALTQRSFVLPSGEALVHEGPVTSVRVSPDGQRIVTASQDGTARVWDARTGKPLGQPLTHLAGMAQGAGMTHDMAIRCAEFSPDGRWVVTGSGDGTARIWNAQTGQPLPQPLKHKGAVLSARFAPDGRVVVTTSEDKTARLWDARTGAALLSQPFVHRGIVSGAEFSPDGGRLVTYSDDMTAQVWDVQSGQRLQGPLQHESMVKSAQFSPLDGRWLLTVSWDERGARLWDVSTGTEMPIGLRHEMSVTSAEFSRDGRRIVTASLDRTAQVWDAQTGQQLGQRYRHDNQVLLARFSADGRSLVSRTADGSVHVWDTNTQLPLVEPLRHQIDSFEVTPDGGELLTVSSNLVCKWNLRVSPPRPRSVNPQPRGNPLTFSPDGKLKVVDLENDSCVQVVQTKTGEPLSEPLCHREKIIAVEFSSDGQRLLTASKDKTARLWDAHTGLPVTEPLLHVLPIKSARFSGQRDKVITVLEDESAWLWEVPVASSRAPRWLPELAEAIGGQRRSDRGMAAPVPLYELLALVQKLTSASRSDSYVPWAQGLLAERTQLTRSESQPNPSP